jgi:hypothetical protein
MGERWRSDRDGAVVFDVGAAGIDVSAFRDSNRRYWMGR